MRDGWALIGRQMLAQRWGLLAGAAAGLVWTAAKVSVPKLIELAIDQGMEKGDQDAVVRYAWAIAGVALVAAAFTGLRRYSAFREARQAEAVLRDRLFAHLQRLHFAYHDGQQTGQLMSRANNDLQQIQNAVVLVPLTIANIATVLAVLVLLVLIDPVLTVLALGSLPLVNVLAKRFATKLHPTMIGVQQESAELSAVVEETVAGIRVVKGFAAEDTQARRLAAEADDLYAVSMDGARIRSTYWPALELLPNVGLIMVLAYGGHQVMAGELSIGALVAFNAYVVLLVWPLRMLGWIVAMSQRAAASAQRVHEVLATEPIVVDPAHPVPLPAGAGAGAVRFEGVRFAYGPDAAPVLAGFDLHVPAGQTVALVGATASGKSTVAKLIPRFYDVDAGPVLPRRDRRASTWSSPSCAGRSAWCSRRRSCSPTPSPPTSPSPTPMPLPRRWCTRLASPAPTSSSASCPTATTPRSASGASRCRAASASASPSPGRSSPTRAC